jgi:hypothetical protein
VSPYKILYVTVFHWLSNRKVNAAYLFVIIFIIIGLFNFAFSSRDSVALNDRIISDL